MTTQVIVYHYLQKRDLEWPWTICSLTIVITCEAEAYAIVRHHLSFKKPLPHYIYSTFHLQLLIWCLLTGKGGDLERLRELQRRRYADPAAIDKIVALDESWRKGTSVLLSYMLCSVPARINSYLSQALIKTYCDSNFLQCQSHPSFCMPINSIILVCAKVPQCPICQKPLSQRTSSLPGLVHWLMLLKILPSRQ